MRTAEIFNGNALIKVTEGSKFRLNGVWNFDIGTSITFNVKQGVDVLAVVRSKDGSGSELEVVSINTIDDMAEMVVEAEDVEVEVIENIIEEKVEEAVEGVSSPKLCLKKNKFTKKELVAYIEEHNLDIDTSKTKADIVKVLESQDLVEYK